MKGENNVPNNTPNVAADVTGNSGQRRSFFTNVLKHSGRTEGDQSEVTGTEFGTGTIEPGNYSYEPGTGNTEPKRRGRKPYPRDAAGNIIRPGTAGNGNPSGETDTETEGITIEPRETGESFGGIPTGEGTETGTVGQAEVKRKRGRPKGNKQGAIKPEHIAGLTAQLFQVAAIIKQAPHWQVTDENELNYWTPSAAELANKYIDETAAQKALEFNAAVTVCMGVGIMVIKRASVDQEIRMKARKEAAVKQAEDIVTPRHPQTPPTARQPQPANVRNMQRADGGGAAPTRPQETIEGLGMQTGGLS